MTVSSKKKESPAEAMARALTRARDAQPRLSAATDELNEQLTVAEKAIRDLNLGVRGWVELEAREDGWTRFLCFGKYQGEWRLIVESGIGFAEEEVPLVNAPRSVRLHAVRFLAALVEKLAESIEDEVKQVEQRRADTERFINSLKAATEAIAPPVDPNDIPF